MKKYMVALLMALLITACVGTSIFTIGGAALFNRNGVTAANSPSQGAQASDASSSQQAQIDQLQSLVSQYQDREQEYQQREQQLKSQLDEANAQIRQNQQLTRQVQGLLEALQNRGLISITSDGRIFIN